MKKPIKAELHHDQDPIDGLKAVGCLFAGLTLLVIGGYIFGLFITWLHTKP